MKKGFCLTKEEMEVGLNPDWVIYAKASPELRAVLDKAAAEDFVEELDADAEGWEAPGGIRKRLWGGFVYRVHPGAPVVEPEKAAPERVELEWLFGTTYGVDFSDGEGVWNASGLACRAGFLEYEYPDGSRSQDFTRAKGLPVAAWFELQPEPRPAE